MFLWLDEGRTGLADGIGLYHMLLEGVVFEAGQHALLEDLEDDVLPGVREGMGRVERDERDPRRGERQQVRAVPYDGGAPGEVHRPVRAQGRS